MASYRKNHKRARKEEETSSLRDNGRDTLHNQDWLSVAYASQGLRPVADRVLFLRWRSPSTRRTSTTARGL